VIRHLGFEFIVKWYLYYLVGGGIVTYRKEECPTCHPTPKLKTAWVWKFCKIDKILDQPLNLQRLWLTCRCAAPLPSVKCPGTDFQIPASWTRKLLCPNCLRVKSWTKTHQKNLQTIATKSYFWLGFGAISCDDLTACQLQSDWLTAWQSAWMQKQTDDITTCTQKKIK
jgi:glutaredoxin